MRSYNQMVMRISDCENIRTHLEVDEDGAIILYDAFGYNCEYNTFRVLLTRKNELQYVNIKYLENKQSPRLTKVFEFLDEYKKIRNNANTNLEVKLYLIEKESEFVNELKEYIAMFSPYNKRCFHYSNDNINEWNVFYYQIN